VNEFFPVLAGLVCGVLLGSLTVRRPLLVGAVCAVVAGVLATVLAGEWRVSWAFLLIDIPLVGVSALVGDVVSRSVVLRRISR
jgi:hypothetical protein